MARTAAVSLACTAGQLKPVELAGAPHRFLVKHPEIVNNS
jgi:hypothetical protein